VVAGGQHPAADARVKAGLELAALAAAQALDLQAAAELEPVQVLQGRVVVGVAGHGQGPAGMVADRLAARLLDLGGEPGPAGGRGQVEGEQLVLAVMELGDRGQHPGGGPGRTPAGGLVDHGHRQAGRGRPPGDAEADDPAPDHHGVRRLVEH
jgi:hypothetical protein